MAELKTLVRKRGMIKSRITSFRNYLEGIKDQIKKNGELTELEIIELKQRTDKIEGLWSEYGCCYEAIIEGVGDDALCEHEEDREQFETSYYRITSVAKQIIGSMSESESPNDESRVSTSHEPGDSARVGSDRGASGKVKLPVLKLPEFDGSYEKWLPFYDTFLSVIHSNDNISAIQKYHYLTSSLTGDASQVIKGLEISAANYKAAWELLEKRYKNKSLMVHNHIKGIVEYPKIAKRCFSSLRNLLNSVQGHMRALKALGQPVDNWDSLLIYLVSDKFDSRLQADWEKERVDEENPPTVSELVNFMEKQCQLLEKLDKSNKETSDKSQTRNSAKGTKNTSLVHASTSIKSNIACPMCKGQHALYTCKSFLDLTPESRFIEVKRFKRCLNCLRSGHLSVNCSAQKCRKCQKSHNTLLQTEKVANSVAGLTDDNSSSCASNETTTSTVSAHVGGVSNMSHVLPTAVVQILDSDGKNQNCTALLDSGSQSNFLSASLCRKLKLKSVPVNLNVLGVNKSESNISEMAKATIKSNHSNLSATLTFLLSPNGITSSLPSEPINLDKLRFPSNMPLADPDFHRPKSIDMLIGVDLFWDLLCPESSQIPYLHKTKLGYVVSGRIPHFGRVEKSTVCNFSSAIPDLSSQLQQFWEIEECPKQEEWSDEAKACESNFLATTKRDSEGRFVVSIPLKRSLESLGDSKDQAERRFSALERKLQRNDELKARYVDFMQQYEQLGHMTKVVEETSPRHVFYLPHHGVLKEDSLTTKLRVVFDGSAASTSGVSINDVQMVGPTVQPDLLSIILRYRMYPYVVGADISMMYRQVWVNPEQRPLQRILWRPSVVEPLEIFNLNTVTYGLASSSYLAIRCLFALADENEESYPRAAKIIRKCMYVDDLLFGAGSVEEAVQIRSEVSLILSSAGFRLRKWISNDPRIVDQSEESDTGLPCHVIKIGEDKITKTLGLSWSSVDDKLVYSIDMKQESNTCSKRSILSLIARIYDPLGLLGPCIIIAKVILQKLWLEKSTWDQVPSSEICSEWKRFVNNLTSMEKLKIPRQVCCSSPEIVEIHAFSDASLVAYGACIYIRSVNSSGEVFVKLLCAKSRVAPLKPTTIPRLELCAAQLAVRLVNNVKDSFFDISMNDCYYWCDSTIVLGWLKLQPHTLKAFVSNRVAEIQSLSGSSTWQHVSSHENPADLISRGVQPKDLQNSSLWWEGPSWLSLSTLKLPSSYEVGSEVPELKAKVKTNAFLQTLDSPISLERYSNVEKLQRILAYCLRFIGNSKIKTESKRNKGVLTAEEMHSSMIQLIKIVQRQSFSADIESLSENGVLNSRSKILKLNPFIHNDGTLRVGGRLGNSDYSFDKKHPILLPEKHVFTKLLFSHEHIKLLHAGPQNLLSCIRERYWPIAGRNLAKKTVHDCVRCFRLKPRPFNQVMGNLPHDRVTPAPAFSTTGVDYAGPFLIKDKKGRGSRSSKCYVALFVCFVTRAVHLELVTDLTADCFILALRRFASRWGMPQKLYSDNGTNFVGANSELKELGNFLKKNQECLSERFAGERFSWTFIPAYSPHFGGIWEAGVKSTKHHLKRVLGNAALTFEEFYSLLSQIGAILNSRPLTPLSPDPLDLHPLTPAHLLVGRSLTSVPDPDVTHLRESHMSRYQRIQQLQQHFWSRWAKEYLSELQCRTKWKTKQDTIKEGMLVLIKNDNLPPMSWHLGRVVELHPGKDLVTRVVSLRTSKGIIRRSIAKLCPLPIEAPTSVSSQ